MELSRGGKTESLTSQPKITEIVVGCEQRGSANIELWINGDSLSYLSIKEAMKLRDELNEAIKTSTGI